MNKEKINSCNNCIMNVPGGEYSGYCNHPSAPQDKISEYESANEQKIIYYDYRVKEEDLPINPNTNKKYHFESNCIPQWCPLRKVKQIDVGIKVNIQLDDNLFEENYLPGGKFYHLTRQR